MSRALSMGSDRERTLFLVNAGMESGRCAAQPMEPVYRFRWKTALWASPP
jgi:hypothetical protein